MIEGDPQIVPGGAAVPVSGRIGVIVYLAIGDATAQLEVVGHEVRTVDGNDVPVPSARNSGNAHGRLRGFVDGRAADGKTYALQPSTLPILPGDTRDLAPAPQAPHPAAPAPARGRPGGRE